MYKSWANFKCFGRMKCRTRNKAYAYSDKVEIKKNNIQYYSEKILQIWWVICFSFPDLLNLKEQI